MILSTYKIDHLINETGIIMIIILKLFCDLFMKHKLNTAYMIIVLEKTIYGNY